MQVNRTTDATDITGSEAASNRENLSYAADELFKFVSPQETTALRNHLSKILKPYEKELRRYLENVKARTYNFRGNSSAKPPDVYNCLFTECEINLFLHNDVMLPLSKLLVLSDIMNRDLMICFYGKRTAQIQLNKADSLYSWLAQLHSNIYSLLAIMGDSTVHQNDLQRSVETADLSANGAAISKLTSFSTIARAAHYYGFEVRIAFRRRGYCKFV